MDYLAIIRKADFVDLFKYGKLNVYSAINFDGNIKAHANDDDLFEKLAKNMNFFEYSFEYMVIHFISDNGNECPCPVSIENVRGLYTFDEEAKKEMSVSFDSRIKLHVSPWGEKFNTLHNNRLMLQSKRGIDNLWAIFDLSETDRKMCESIITDDIVSEVFDELFSYKRPTGEQSIWTYLLRYERHSFYPNNTKGYFCDYIHVACNWLKKIELQEDVAETTGLYTQIINCSKDDFASLSNIAVRSNLSSLTDEDAGCKFAIAAPLFLLMKDKFSDGFCIDSKIINYAKKFGLECSVAVYLLGLTLGYDKTYDAYYDFIKLPIFETKQPTIEIESSNKIEPIHNTPTVKQGILFYGGKNVNNDGQKIPVAWLRKSRGTYSIKPAFDENDIRRLVGEGYEVPQFLREKAKIEIVKQGYEVPSSEAIKQAYKKYGAWK